MRVRRAGAHQGGGEHKVPEQKCLAPAARVPGELAGAVLQVGAAEVVHVRPGLRSAPGTPPRVRQRLAAGFA